jgi:hypothetical protein
VKGGLTMEEGLNAGLYMDLVMSHLRRQINELNAIVDNVERTSDYKDDYVQESIKTVERELHRLRKFIR